MEKFDPLLDDTDTRDFQRSSSANDSLWTVEDVAIYLKLQPETIRSMARRGELPALKLGKAWRFQRIAIHNLITSLE